MKYKMKRHPVDRLMDLYEVFKHRQTNTNDSIVMVGDLEEFEEILSELKQINE